MKKLNVLLACTIALALAGCSSTYRMETNDGRTIVAQGKPLVDDETGMISYKDADGKTRQMNRADLKEMSEVGQ